MTTIFISVLSLLVVFLLGFGVGQATTDAEIIKIAEKLKQPDYFCKCGCGGDWCYMSHCSSRCWEYNQPKTVRGAILS